MNGFRCNKRAGPPDKAKFILDAATKKKPIAGVLNSVNGGRRVPLKFTVHVNGVEQTTAAGLQMTVQAISCDSSAP